MKLEMKSVHMMFDWFYTASQLFLIQGLISSKSLLCNTNGLLGRHLHRETWATVNQACAGSIHLSRLSSFQEGQRPIKQQDKLKELERTKWDSTWSSDTTVNCNLTGNLSITVSHSFSAQSNA